MEIGEPRRVITVEPIESPVPVGVPKDDDDLPVGPVEVPVQPEPAPA